MPRQNLSLLLPRNPATGAALATPLNPDPIITGITADYRSVAPGNLFAAIPNYDLGGLTTIDGTPYIDTAIAMGAAAILAPTGTARHDRTDVAFLTVDNPEAVLCHIAANFYAAQPRTLAAVTGTNGKTSTAQFTRQLWAMSGLRAASYGALGLIAPHLNAPPFMTTPHAVELHRTLAMLAENGITHTALEASSHGLQQHRMHGVKLAVAGFTNLTRDHLNYHGSMEAYRDAKLRLFTEVLPYDAPAVLNADSPVFDYFQKEIQRTNTTIITYGQSGEHLRLIECKPQGHRQQLTVEAWGTVYNVDLPLVGAFQAENALCAAAMVIAAGEPASMIIPNLARLQPVRGRLEFIGTTSKGADVYVDYAHTPDGLETVLRTMRPVTKHRLQVLFGVGGGSDPAKGPQMGHIANAYADRVIITDDNPRLADPAALRAGILSTAPNAVEIPDRGIAIQAAVGALQSGDVLIIAGKGHEQTQIIGANNIPFDDAEVARFALTQKYSGVA